MKKTYKKLISIILTITIFLQSIPIIISAKSISGFSPIIKEENPTSEEVFIVNEDISLRQKYSKHFYMSDKTYLVATYDSPVHYLQNGQWVDIDNSFDEEIDDDEKAVLKNKTNAFEIKFSKKAKKNKLVSVKKGRIQIRMVP